MEFVEKTLSDKQKACGQNKAYKEGSSMKNDDLKLRACVEVASGRRGDRLPVVLQAYKLNSRLRQKEATPWKNGRVIERSCAQKR